MNAAEHTEAAENLLAAVQHLQPAEVMAMMAKAQVHATLAVAARLGPPRPRPLANRIAEQVAA
jgi:hypothetical protein